MAALRDRKFFSLEEAKEAVREKLEELNNKPFQKRPGCRKSAYEEEEKTFMRPLPPVPYEPAIWLSPKVSTDYLISDGKNKYSVPFDLIGENVDVRITKNTVEAYYNGTRVATHVRLQNAQRDPIVKPEHMPEAHRRYLQEYNAEEFESWGKSVGPKTSEVVHYFLTSGREVEQGYKSCASLKKLEKSYSAKRLEYACSRALTLSPMPTIRNINILIKSKPEKEPEKSAPIRDGKSHGFVRGAAYYSKGGQHDE